MVAGCGKGETIVKGTVTYKGTPIKGGSVDLKILKAGALMSPKAHISALPSGWAAPMPQQGRAIPDRPA